MRRSTTSVGPRQAWALPGRIALGGESKERIAALVAVDDAEDAIAADCEVENEAGDRGERLVLGKLKEAAGSVSLETMQR